MSRFIKIRTAKENASLEEISERARAAIIGPNSESGFEIESVTKEKIVLTWFEKIVIERRIETGAFSGITFSEVKIITFTFLVGEKAKSVIIVDPPLGKERVHKALRHLFKTANFVFMGLDIPATLANIALMPEAKVTAIETEPIEVVRGIDLALKISGTGDVMNYLSKKHAKHGEQIRTVAADIPIRGGRIVEASFARSGLIRLGEELTHLEIEDVARILRFE